MCESISNWIRRAWRGTYNPRTMSPPPPPPPPPLSPPSPSDPRLDLTSNDTSRDTSPERQQTSEESSTDSEAETNCQQERKTKNSAIVTKRNFRYPCARRRGKGPPPASFAPQTSKLIVAYQNVNGLEQKRGRIASHLERRSKNSPHMWALAESMSQACQPFHVHGWNRMTENARRGRGRPKGGLEMFTDPEQVGITRISLGPGPSHHGNTNNKDSPQ